MKPRVPLHGFLHVLAAAAAIPSAATFSTGCVVPPTANMQSARTMEPRQFRLNPYYSRIEEKCEGAWDWKRERNATGYGALLGIGLSPNTEFQLRYERIELEADEDGYSFTSFGPKISAVEDILAFAIPVGLYWGGAYPAFDTIQLHPGAIATLPVNRYLEINAAGKLICPLNSVLYKWGVVNLGLSVSTDVTRWAILPEVGFAWNLSEDNSGSVFTYGIAVAFYPTVNDVDGEAH
jgi:hypothetical protein